MLTVRFWYLRRRPEAVRNEVDEELRIHLEMRIEDLRANGLSPDEARREAERQFGDLEGTRRYCRRQDLEKENRVQRLLFVQDLAQDARIGLRNLLRVPALTLTVVVTVGLGIGATTAIFAAVNAALLQPLAVQGSGPAGPNLYGRPAQQSTRSRLRTTSRSRRSRPTSSRSPDTGAAPWPSATGRSRSG